MIATLKKVESMEKPHVPMATVAINENTILEVGNWLPINEDFKIKSICLVLKLHYAGNSGWLVLMVISPLISPLWYVEAQFLVIGARLEVSIE